VANPDLIVVVADALRLRAIRLAGHFHGRVLYFSDTNLISAFESIRAHEPAVVALEGHFAHTGHGRAFAERLQKLALPGLEVHLVTFSNGAWSTGPLSGPRPAAGVSAAAAAAQAEAIAVNTRRVPRFPVVNHLQLKIDGQSTSLVDMSVMGAQVISTPTLRPNQKLKVTLPDEGDSLLSVSGVVAWSFFEMPSNAPRPYYRAGMEFTDAAMTALEGFCKRNCSDQPLRGW
jgi:hypothetical protein